MQVTYYGYRIKRYRARKNKTFLFDLRGFFQAFSTSVQWQQNEPVLSAPERLYSFKVGSGLGSYLFVKTLDAEQLKNIDNQTLSVDELSHYLGRNSSAGISSYYLVRQHIVAIASTFRAPGISVLGKFVNELFSRIGLERYQLVFEPFDATISKEQLLDFDTIKTATIEIPSDGLINRAFTGPLGMLPRSHEIGSIQITIKPKKGGTVTDVIKSMVNSLNPQELEKFRVRGKEDAVDAILNYVLIGSSKLSHPLPDDVKGDPIIASMTESMLGNTGLKVATEDFVSEHGPNRVPDEFSELITPYSESAAWDRMAGSE